MSPILVHVCGPLSIHWYGLMIACGVLIALWLLHRDRALQKIVQISTCFSIVEYSILFGYLGGRILFLISENRLLSDWSMILKFWEPGLSILGSILGILLVLFLYVGRLKINTLALLDRLVIYAPLVQAFGRLGCFFAGCCYGQPLDAFWAVTYMHTDHLAPLGIGLHPTQLYSAGFLFALFCFFYFVVQHRVKKPGMLLCAYVFCVGLERFLIDFIRWDRVFADSGFWSLLCVHQWVALGMMVSSVIGLFVLKRRK